jgi:transcriptional regulator with XRE-family HTH domain
MNTRISQERVKVIRLGKSWTQQNLADKANISLRSIQRIENEGVASLQSRAAIASAFGIDPTELELDDSQQNSIPVLLAILVFFSYSSFYLGLTMFEISLATIPVWAIPLLPSITILIFGSILQSNTTDTKKRFLSILGCLFLAMLLSPPEPSLKQFSFTVILWLVFETTYYLVNAVSRKATKYQFDLKSLLVRE